MTFQALYDVAQAQSQTVREVERRLTEVQQELEAAVSQKADANDLRATAAALGNLRATADLVSHRVEEEAQCAIDAQRLAAEEAQAFRTGLTELRTSLERQRADVQQWRTGLEAGLARLAAECAAATQAVQAECQAALQQDIERLEVAIEERAEAWAAALDESREALQREVGHLGEILEDRTSSLKASLEEDCQALIEERIQDINATMEELALASGERAEAWRAALEENASGLMAALEEKAAALGAAIDEKATPEQLREIVREAWQREEGQFSRLQRLCEAKVSANEFAALAALAEGKASLAELEGSVQRHVRKRLAALVSEQQLLGRTEVTGIAEAAASELRQRLQECERRAEEHLQSLCSG